MEYTLEQLVRLGAVEMRDGSMHLKYYDGEMQQDMFYFPCNGKYELRMYVYQRLDIKETKH